jgi:UDP-glucuronate decarboxylase
MDPEDGRVVSNFLVQAIKGEPLTVYGDGTQTRSFCYVDDMISGLVALMHTEGDLAQPVNLGNPGEFTVLELAQMVLEETGSGSQLETLPLPIDDPNIRRPDISRAMRELSWEPSIPLREGLRLSMSYFEKEIASDAMSQKAVKG